MLLKIQRPRVQGPERGASLTEVLVATGLLAAAVLLLGSGASLWQTGLQWPVERYEQIHLLQADLALWPAEPLEICGVDDPEEWWTQISQHHKANWGSPEIWVTDQGWVAIPWDNCAGIPPDRVSVIRASVIRASEYRLETVVLVSRS